MERLLLQKTLSDILGCPDRGEKCRVYCIVYEHSRIEPTFADNQPYALHDRYQVTVIYRNPDSEIPSKIALLPMCSHERHYTKENLNHDVFNLYF